ncbi:dTDP-4-dehydrorhamnose 3,5-epimerase family protein [Candidatus Pelagibacter sp. HIMB1611]|uniref:dTDP-4-dehydrorhamnose 3,5-epimerase family protein n=1 Tax=unclassified Candidatus Pelagibacter TaxID=2647897 RepID=UPI003F85E6FD
MAVKKKINNFFNNAVKIYKTKKIKDNRGYLKKLYSDSDGINDLYISISKKKVFRGIHYVETNKKIKKNIYCLGGEFVSIFVDLRKNSKTYMNVKKFLFNKNIYIAEINGKIGHGMLSLKDNTLLMSSANIKYNPKNEKVLNWKKIKFKWPFKNLILSKKDT